MATKKQKHAAALAKREEFLAEVKAEGLRALEADRERQKERREAMVSAAREINARYNEILEAAGNLVPTVREATAKVDGFAAVLSTKPKRKTSFYSEAQGRPVNAAAYYAEKRREKQ